MTCPLLSRLIAIIWTMLLWSNLMGQIHLRDHIILRNGSEVWGAILEEHPGRFLLVQVGGYELRTLAWDQLEEVVHSYGQKGYWRTVYLQKGGKMQGVITLHNSQTLQLKSVRGYLYDYRIDEIKRIVLEPVPEGDNEAYALSKQAEKNRRKEGKKGNPDAAGYFRYIQEYGLLSGRGSNGETYWGILTNQIGGYQVSERYCIGLGFHLQALTNGQESLGNIRALFLDNRFYFPYEHYTLYFNLDAGYAYNWPGPMLSPALGARFQLYGFNCNFSLGFNIINYDPRLDNYPNNEPQLLQSIQAKIVID